jgi:hypothetical protein
MSTRPDIDEVAAQVARNCRIADARAWGGHSLCGLLLRLRELYKREHGLRPWSRVATEAILPWIGEREAEWAQLEEAEPGPVRIGRRAYDPFDEEGISARLLPHGWLYAAGEGPGGRALFVLAEVLERREAAGAEVFVVGRELVRDLSPTPAMSRPGRIVARAAIMPWFLWSALEEAGTKHAPGPAAHALLDAGLDPAAVLADPGAHEAALEAIARRELEVAVRHEIGEIAEDRRAGRAWGALIRRAAGTKAEILARALKDALADAGEAGTLRHIVEHRLRGSLALFAASDRGLRRRTLPEARRMWDAVRERDDWAEAERVRAGALSRLESHVGPLFGIFADDPALDEARRRADALEDLLLGAKG